MQGTYNTFDKIVYTKNAHELSPVIFELKDIFDDVLTPGINTLFKMITDGTRVKYFI